MRLRCECGETFEEGEAACPVCNRPVESASPVEDAARRGAVGWFLDTTYRALFRPTEFFRSLPASEGLLRPLIYAAVVNTLVALLSVAEMSLQKDVPAGARIPMLVFAAVSPLIAVPVLFIVAGVVHLCGLIVGCSQGGYEATFRALAYASAASLLNVVPIVGPFAAGVWGMVIEIVGLRELHRSTTGRAVLAALMPLLAVLFLALLLAVPFLVFALPRM